MLRPSRWLAAATVSTAWPLLALTPGRAFGPRSDPGVGLLLVLLPYLLAVYVLAQRPEIGALAEPPRLTSMRGLAIAGVVALGVAVLLRQVPSAPLRLAAALSSLAAAAAAGAHFMLAQRASGWASGRLELDGGGRGRLRCEDATYVLDRVPSGRFPGDTLTLPVIELADPHGGPYRRGRARGYAPHVLSFDAHALSASLRGRGVVLAGWGFFGGLVAVGAFG